MAGNLAWDWEGTVLSADPRSSLVVIHSHVLLTGTARSTVLVTYGGLGLRSGTLTELGQFGRRRVKCGSADMATL